MAGNSMTINRDTRRVRMIEENIKELLEKNTQAFKIHTVQRIKFLWFKGDVDTPEVVIVMATLLNLIHRLVFAHEGASPMVYLGMKQVFGDELYTCILILLTTMGISSFMLYLPRIRKEIVLVVSMYFVVSGVILLLNVRESLLAWYYIFLFGGMGLWTYWSHGRKKIPWTSK